MMRDRVPRQGDADGAAHPEPMTSREALAFLDDATRREQPFLLDHALASVVAHAARALRWSSEAERARLEADAAERRHAHAMAEREETLALGLAAERATTAEAEARAVAAEARAHAAERAALRTVPLQEECAALRAKVAELELGLDRATFGMGPDAETRAAYWQDRVKELHAARLEAERKLCARNAEVDARKAQFVDLMRLLAEAPASEVVHVQLHLGRYSQITAVVSGAGVKHASVTGYVPNSPDAGASLADCFDAAIAEARRALRERVEAARAVTEHEAVRAMLAEETRPR